MRIPARRAILLLLAAFAVAWPSPATRARPPASPAQGSADELLPVDCVLPGKIRKLGKKLTYLTPRQAIKTTALDCEIRGGEYVAYDRASYQTALAVWQPQAERGDPKAQNYVGEIYERGLGTQPNHAEAARWYRRAAEQGYAPAQVNLGQLYEQGRGVPRDTAQALEWYRKASGLEALDLPFVVAADSSAEVARLRRELSESSQEVESLRTRLSELQAELESSREQRDDRRSEVEGDRQALEATRRVLAAETNELAEERSRLAAERERLERQRAESAAAGGAAGPTASELNSRETALAEQEQKLARRSQALEQREHEIAASEQTLASKQAEVDRLDAEIDKLRRQAEEQRQQVLAQSESRTVALSGPSIHLIDPSLPTSRSAGPVVRMARDAEERVIVGKVEAPAGLLTLTVNDAETPVKENGIFQSRVRVLPGGSHVTIIAIDKQGKRDDRAFTLVPAEGETALAAREEPPKQARGPKIDWGNYYALVIGNQNYARLPTLDTAQADADAVASLLERKYGFQVTKLHDASRYQILSALNELRGKLTEKDNLLIYYAGHGELDEVNMRGHWLPVDAEPDNNANWISNVSLTDLLNAMSARHVIVVADSCYSGALTRSALARLERGMTPEARVSWQRKMVEHRSRLALTSGGLKPVLDGGGGRHSIFAKALLQVLERNQEVLEGHRLFSEISALVTWAAEAQRFDQVPQYAPIKYAGHESGDFFFVPKG